MPYSIYVMPFAKDLTNIERAALAALWHEGGMSRRDLGAELAVSRPTVERALTSLLRQELVMQSDVESPRRGRPAKRFGIRPDAWATLGMDLELPEIHLVLSDAVGETLAESQFETRDAHDEPGDVLRGMASRIRSWLSGLSSPLAERIIGLGIGVPGFLTPRGVSFVGRNLPKWEQVPVQTILEESLGLPVLIQHDVHLMALEELTLRKSSEEPSLFFSVRPGLNHDLRIGGAICMNGAVYSGGRGNGGALYRASVDLEPLADHDEDARLRHVAQRLAETMVHAVLLIDPLRVVVHAECMGSQEGRLLDLTRTALDELLQGEYVGEAELTRALIRASSGAHQASIAVTHRTLTPMTWDNGGDTPL